MVTSFATILVVDDDPSLAEMLTIVLEAEGFETSSVTDGAEAHDEDTRAVRKFLFVHDALFSVRSE